MDLRIYAIDRSGYREEITDLYWFEERGVHDWGGEGSYDQYSFELFLDGEPIYLKVVGTIFGMKVITSKSISDGEIKFAPPLPLG